METRGSSDLKRKKRVQWKSVWEEEDVDEKYWQDDEENKDEGIDGDERTGVAQHRQQQRRRRRWWSLLTFDRKWNACMLCSNKHACSLLLDTVSEFVTFWLEQEINVRTWNTQRPHIRQGLSLTATQIKAQSDKLNKMMMVWQPLKKKRTL